MRRIWPGGIMVPCVPPCRAAAARSPMVRRRDCLVRINEIERTETRIAGEARLHHCTGRRVDPFDRAAHGRITQELRRPHAEIRFRRKTVRYQRRCPLHRQGGRSAEQRHQPIREADARARRIDDIELRRRCFTAGDRVERARGAQWVALHRVMHRLRHGASLCVDSCVSRSSSAPSAADDEAEFGSTAGTWCCARTISAAAARKIIRSLIAYMHCRASPSATLGRDGLRMVGTASACWFIRFTSERDISKRG